jgi:hypothetical protein
MRPDVARDALLATHGGLSLELCAVIGHISPMALYRLVCAFGHHSLVTVLTRCGLPLPVYVLADEKHSRCLTDKVQIPSDLVVKSQAADIIDLILQLIGHLSRVHRPCRNRKSRGAVLSTSEGQWATTKFDGVCKLLCEQRRNSHALPKRIGG